MSSEQLRRLKLALDEVADKLMRVSNELGMMITDLEAERKPTGQKIPTLSDVQVTLGPERIKELTFEERDDVIIVKPKRWLGSDLFNQIWQTLRQLGDVEYVSAGKRSHWKVKRSG